MKKFTLLLLSVIVGQLVVNAQSISPSTTDVYCPGVSTTFTVTVSGFPFYNPYAAGTPNTGIAGSKAIAVTSGVSMSSTTINGNYVTYFTFTGNFVDYAGPQGVILTFKDPGGQDLSYTFTYTNITSFNLGNNNVGSVPQPTPASIQATSCQVQSFNIAIPKVQYIDNYVSSPTPYGAVTSFQYLLPVGWQLGGVISDGTTWLTGAANVTVTSDATHGGTIQVRGAPCSANLLPGGIASIAITRPAPTSASYSINGAGTLCSGASSNYSVSGLVPGSTVSWAVNPAGVVTIASPNSTSTDLAYAGAGVATLTATITDPCGNSAVTGFSLTAGIPTPTLSVTTYPAPAYAFAARATYIPGAAYAWYLNGQRGGGNSQAYTDIVDCGTRNTLYVQATNSCGTSTSNNRLLYIACNGGGGRMATSDTAHKITKALSQPQHVNISPNPGPGAITVSTSGNLNSKIFQIRVIDELGRVRGLFNYPTGVSVTRLNLVLGNGLYILQTYDHNNWSSHFLLIQK